MGSHQPMENRRGRGGLADCPPELPMPDVLVRDRRQRASGRPVRSAGAPGRRPHLIAPRIFPRNVGTISSLRYITGVTHEAAVRGSPLAMGQDRRVLRQLGTLLTVGTAGELTDGQLLER